MWAMVLIGRARAARKKPLHKMHANSGIADDKKQDHRMPAQFIGGSLKLSSCALAAPAALALDTPSDHAVAVLAGEKGEGPDAQGSVKAEAVASHYLTCCAAINGACFLRATTGLFRMRQEWQGCMT